MNCVIQKDAGQDHENREVFVDAVQKKGKKKRAKGEKGSLEQLQELSRS